MLGQLVLCAAGWAATLTVGSGKDYATIDEALQDAVDGDLILVDPGLYVDRLLIKADVTIRSTDGPATTTIADGDDWQLSVVKIWNDAKLDGFTFTTTDEDWRHCVRVAPGGTVEVINSIFTGCTAGDGLGGGLRFDVDTAGLVTDTVFVDNLAPEKITGRAAHLYSRADMLTIQRCTFENGYTESGDGGAIYANSGVVTIEDSTFVNNHADDDGGAIALDGEPHTNPDGTFSEGVSRLVLRNNTFESNGALDKGGALFVRDVVDVDISGNTLCMNSAGYRGGAMYLENDAGSVTNNVMIDHFAGEDGGSLFLKDAAPVIENNHFLGSEALDQGGAIVSFAAPDVVLRNVIVAWTRSAPAIRATHGGSFDNSHNAMHSNADGDFDDVAAGAGDVFADPLLRDFNDNGVCRDDDLRLDTTSPLVDAGDPALVDVDGSTSDIGAFGGSEADLCVGAPEPLPAICLR